MGWVDPMQLRAVFRYSCKDGQDQRPLGSISGEKPSFGEKLSVSDESYVFGCRAKSPNAKNPNQKALK